MREVTDSTGNLELLEDRFILYMNISDHIYFSEGEVVKCKGNLYKIISITPVDAKMERYEIVGQLITNLDYLEMLYGKDWKNLLNE